MIFFLTHKPFKVRAIGQGLDHVCKTQRLALGELRLIEADCLPSTTESADDFFFLKKNQHLISFTTSASKLVQIRRSEFYSLTPFFSPPTTYWNLLEKNLKKETTKLSLTEDWVLLELPGTLWAGGWGEGGGGGDNTQVKNIQVWNASRVMEYKGP